MTSITTTYDDDIVSLKIGQTTFAAHRALLVSQSKVFKTQLKTLQDGEPLEVANVEAVVLGKLLDYIYKGNLNKATLDEHAIQLWAVGITYEIEPLKQLCESHLCSTITSETVIDILLLASTTATTIPRLQQHCIEYINSHPTQVLGHADKWSKLVQQGSSSLWGDLLGGLVKKRWNPILKKAKKLDKTTQRLENEQEGWHLFVWYWKDEKELDLRMLALGLLVMIGLEVAVLVGYALFCGFSSDSSNSPPFFIFVAIFLLLVILLTACKCFVRKRY